ncbi:hypothetical protein [Bradyrhizobium septentrionale]|uniref:Uncharacterized protein n=1 Tax=Bradyrhizobium septentrionale TaxID=1404411 RepID=A0A973VZH5_9BRAD|nr:hypothetical protein [Bradyrhizobium septentrionale]UGY13524.1 hypothetical protein HAP48_0033800 [Bradyrhizobium septentrionale]UGY22166.1 hypothetical protein HU675_0029755 [Bradyrhizobium septentrionale]
MTSGQDANSKAQAEAGESLKDGAQNTGSKVSPAADALSDSSLDDVSGGSWPYNNAVRASIGATGGGG